MLPDNLELPARFIRFIAGMLLYVGILNATFPFGLGWFLLQLVVFLYASYMVYTAAIGFCWIEYKFNLTGSNKTTK